MTKMLAMAVPERDGPFRAEERDLPEPGRLEVRIRVQACGGCHSDTATVQGLMPGITYPRIPGHEVIGAIDAIGPDVEGWSVGQRAGVGWFSRACGWCEHCRRGDSFACRIVQGATGVTCDGGGRAQPLPLAGCKPINAARRSSGSAAGQAARTRQTLTVSPSQHDPRNALSRSRRTASVGRRQRREPAARAASSRIRRWCDRTG